MPRRFLLRCDLRSLLPMCLLSVVWLPTLATAAPKPDEGDWTLSTDPVSELPVMSMSLVLHPAHEARPALQDRLIPDSFDLVDSNAALYYLRAMGFLEQSNAQEQQRAIWKAARDRAVTEEKSIGDLPPFVWNDTPPSKLPLDEVKDYLQLTAFQSRDMESARLCRYFDLDRNVEQQESAILYLLPEIQSMRELARLQSMRCRVAIAENRFDDALKIIGQQFALAHHLSDEPFLVSNLVGAAVGSIAFTDMLYLIQMPNSRNLYWALMALPNPLVNTSNSISVERQILFIEVKPLQEVTETTRSQEFWRDFINRSLPGYARIINSEGNAPFPRVDGDEITDEDRAVFVAAIAAAYPGARRYLIDVLKIDQEKVDSYPMAQTVFLAQKKFYEIARDDFYKWSLVDFVQAVNNPQYQQVSETLQETGESLGWASTPVTILFPSIVAVRTAANRVQANIALLQTLEAIRVYGAASNGKLPESLSDLTLPVPLDPFTGKYMQYEKKGESAILTCAAPTLIYQITVQMAR